MNLRVSSRVQRFGAQPPCNSVHRLYRTDRYDTVAMSARVPSNQRADRDKTCYPSLEMRSGRQLLRPHLFAEIRSWTRLHGALTRRAGAFVVSLPQRGKSTGAFEPCSQKSNSSPSCSRPQSDWPVVCPATLSAQALAPLLAVSPRRRSTATWRRALLSAPQAVRFATTSTSADHQLTGGAPRAAANFWDCPGQTARAVLFCFKDARRAAPEVAKTKGRY